MIQQKDVNVPDQETDSSKDPVKGRVVPISREEKPGSRPMPSFLSGKPPGAPDTPDVPDPSAPGAHHHTGMDRQVKKSRWTLRRIAWGAGIALFVGAVLYEFLFGDHSRKLNVQVERITISTVAHGPFQEFIPIRGTVLPIQTIFLDALVGGRVEEIYMEEGTMVEKGDPILKLSDPNLELSVMQQEAMFFEQINNMENTRLQIGQQRISRQRDLIGLQELVQRSKRQFGKDSELMKRNLIAPDQYETSKDRYDFAVQRFEFMLETLRQDSIYRVTQLSHLDDRAKRLEMNLKVSRKTLENLILRAPVTGQLSSLEAEMGELKARGQRFGKVDVMDGFRVRAQIDEFYIARIQKGLTGTGTFSSNEFGLTIRRVFPQVQEGQFEVDIVFDGEAPQGIRTGQTLPIKLALGDLEEALLLARGGFYQTTGGNWVFVVDESGEEAVRRDVRIGRQNPEFFEVLDGLQPGERVVTSSYENYEEIDKLILQR